MESSSIGSSGAPILPMPVETSSHKPKVQDTAGLNGQSMADEMVASGESQQKTDGKKFLAEKDVVPTFIRETAHNQSVKEAKLELSGVAPLHGNALTLEKTVKKSPENFSLSNINRPRIELEFSPWTEEVQKSMLKIADVISREDVLAADGAFMYEATLMCAGILNEKLLAAARGEITDINDLNVFPPESGKTSKASTSSVPIFSGSTTASEEVSTTSSSTSYAVGGEPLTFKSLLAKIALLIHTQNELLATAQEVSLEQASLSVKSSIAGAKSLVSSAKSSLTANIVGFSMSVGSSGYSLYGMKQSAVASQQVTPGMTQTNQAITQTNTAIKSSKLATAAKANNDPNAAALQTKANDDIATARKALNEPGVDTEVKKAGMQQLANVEQGLNPSPENTAAIAAINKAADSSAQAAESAKVAAEAKKAGGDTDGALEGEANDRLATAQNDHAAAKQNIDKLSNGSAIKDAGNDSLGRLEQANKGSSDAVKQNKSELAEASLTQAEGAKLSLDGDMERAAKEMTAASGLYNANSTRFQNEAFHRANIKYGIIAGVGNAAGGLVSQGLSNYYGTIGQAEQKMSEADTTLYQAAVDAMNQTVKASLDQAASIRQTMNAIMSAQSQIVRDTAA